MDKILIIDYGSQYTQLISRRIREINVYTEIWSWDHNPQDIIKFKPKGIVLSGGPAGINDKNPPILAPEILDLNLPILAICYGMHLITKHFRGKVIANSKREYGYAKAKISGNSLLFQGIVDDLDQNNNAYIDVWMSHGDHVAILPNNFQIIASTNSLPIAGFYHRAKNIYGLQFHPEVHHTLSGKKILHKFAYDICNCNGDWQMSDFIKHSMKKIKAQVGKDHVILGLSGGVDSAVAATLIHQAIDQYQHNQLHCVFVDHGLLRLGESQEVVELFQNQLKIDLQLVDAKNEFYQALAGVSEPEQKRKIIGKKFIEIFKKVANQRVKQLGNAKAKWLAQGTIYPDVIESANSKTKKAQNIKSHHNVGGLPADLDLKLLEPLRELFKDEVRKTGIILGLPEKLINRHPFPGPGLAVRILGEVNADRVEILQIADDIFIKALQESGWYQKTAQAFAVFLPVKSVGVMGDNRTYQNCIALRAVQTEDFMTANHAPLPNQLLSQIAQEIINKVKCVNRVVYDITSKPPATIEWE